ncbi:hypothetical protein Fcan01_16436, partial [Folsomia candida]
VYVYQVDKTGAMYWRADGKSWKSIRSKNVGKLKLRLFQLLSNGSSVQFFRSEYTVDENPGYVLGFYNGDFRARRLLHGDSSPGKTPVKAFISKDPETPQSQGKGKDVQDDDDDYEDVDDDRTGFPFVTSHKSVKKNLSETLQSTTMKPTAVYRQATMATFDDISPSSQPRNIRQVYNIASEIKRKTSVRDDMYELFCMTREYEKFVLNFQLASKVNVVVAHPAMVAHTNDLLEIFSTKNEYVVFHYDTTYGVGGFYLSLMSMRYPLLEGNPIIVIGSCMHEASDTSSHSQMFQSLCQELPLLNSDTTIIRTDREAAISGAIRLNPPDAQSRYCWNHLRDYGVRRAGEIGPWAQKHFGVEAAHNYRADFFQLLSCETEDEYVLMLEDFRETWDPQFQDYYNTYINTDVINSGRWAIQKLGIYNPDSGITNNAAESANFSVKQGIKCRINSRLYQVGLSVYYLQAFNLMEITRGLTGHVVIDGKIPEDVSRGNAEKPRPVPTTTLGIAKMLVMKRRIEFAPASGTFVVRGLFGPAHNVHLGNQTCTCARVKRAGKKGSGRVRVEPSLALSRQGKIPDLTPSSPTSSTGGLACQNSSDQDVASPTQAESAIKKLRYIALDLIPPISQTNVESTILSNPKITFGDLKSLAIQLKRAECGVLNKLQLHCVGPSIKYDEDHPGWLTDAVIDDFHHLCVNSAKTVSLPSGSTHCFLELEDGATLPNTTL